MRTPISKKDPMGLTKTMDSVEMLKKKKSTQPKDKKFRVGQNFNQTNKDAEMQNKLQDSRESSDDENQMDEDNDTPICINTTPVGR